MNKQEIYKYLNGKIEFCERYVKVLQNKVDNYDKVPQGPLDPFEEQPKEYYIELLNDYKYALNIYQQIKVELEAWYICKQHSHINKYEDINKNRKKKRFDISIWLNTENCDFKSCATYKDCLKVRKALEVKDEKED